MKGIQVSADYGTPFLAATQVFDVRPVPRKWLSLDRTSDHAQRLVTEGTILLTCSGSVGRATLADASIANTLISHDLLRIDVNDDAQRGWVYAYLRAPTVRAMMTSAQYGHMIKHLEIGHLNALPFIEIPEGSNLQFSRMARDVVKSRNRAHELVSAAEARFEAEIGTLPDLGDGTVGFSAPSRDLFGSGRRLEAHYHNPIARSADRAVASSNRKLERLADLVEQVFIPGRFKHVYGPDGLPYLDSAQILEVAPDVEKYVLSLQGERRAGYLVEAGTLMLPCSGQLHGIIGSVVLAGEWHENKVLTNHIMRITPKQKPSIRIGYLQAVLSHPKLGRPRVLRGAYGSSVPELSTVDIENLAVPRLSAIAETEIADAMEEAATLMAHANSVEDRIAEEAELIVRSFLSAPGKAR
ncbi:restriction endonuclease subunit S domain-containing protein [Aquibium oceanicum]|uniref:Type I restriction modification DNA specificity domain-containing protein n=1 Tax=Aquibium oceanicum TaxID=1670800 RepID=A0A1L3SNQ2_9HYPH|nr:hypothetical protein [Aquibium oceanicum]APH71034.1 hypothetical protein BSQ44_06360 [Aquibium oceanicum]